MRNDDAFYFILTLFKMDLFVAAYIWGVGQKAPPPPKTCCTYPAMVKLIAVVTWLIRFKK